MNDPAIRKILKRTELAGYMSDPNSRVVEELKLPVLKSRIDIAVVNGFLHGYEIKSAKDTLQRLSSQINAYSKVFDYLTVVTESKYQDRLNLPDWVGLAVCSDDNYPEFEIINPPIFNNKVEGFYIAKLLWHSELIELLIANGISFKKKHRNWILCELLASNIDTKILSALVREKLKKRSEWKIKSDL
jgi:hypothetical protein